MLREIPTIRYPLCASRFQGDWLCAADCEARLGGQERRAAKDHKEKLENSKKDFNLTRRLVAFSSFCGPLRLFSLTSH